MLPNIDRRLLPLVQYFQGLVEQGKRTLEKTFSRKTIEKACHHYTQKVAQQNPQILFPSEVSLTFYRQMAQPKKLADIVLEQIREDWLASLPSLGLGEHQAQVTQFIQGMRISVLKNYIGPGELSTLLYTKGWIPIENQKNPSAKQVRFASPLSFSPTGC